jgi:hypothetical protein
MKSEHSDGFPAPRRLTVHLAHIQCLADPTLAWSSLRSMIAEGGEANKAERTSAAAAAFTHFTSGAECCGEFGFLRKSTGVVAASDWSRKASEREG